MSGPPILRTVALAASTALLLTAVAAPVSAAKPMCMGHKATKVGTNKADVIRGTAKRDVIVAKAGNDVVLGLGGNDIICGNAGNDRIVGNAGHDRISGGTGRDRLFGGGGVDRLFGGVANDLLAGGAGPDVLSGQLGNDRLDGGIGIDLCQQGAGGGPRVRCELPKAIVPPPAPKAPVPDPIVLTNVLAIAYTDLNRNHAPDAGDVMIAQWVDTDPGGQPSIGDTIEMGMYPTSLTPVWPADFEAWNVKSHTVTGPIFDGPDFLSGDIGGGDWVGFSWLSPGFDDEYRESSPSSKIVDHPGTDPDRVQIAKTSPSQPARSFDKSAPGTGDDYLIDVEPYFTP